MFRSTQCYMFRPLSSLAHFRLHPPLPLNPRESKQLLNLLTTSFRQQLDREHGMFRIQNDAQSKPVTPLSNTNPAPTKRRRYSYSKYVSGKPTDRHLHSVLSNPLFSYAPEKAAATGKDSRDPMDVFDEACAKGCMKMEYARACLKAKKNLIVQSSALSVKDAMCSSSAGSKVLRWLISSGEANSIGFLQDENFADVLIQFLVAEQLQDVVWTWLDRLFLSISKAASQQDMDVASRTASQVLHTLVRAESSGFVRLDSGYASLGRALKELEGVSCRKRVLSKAGLFLSRESTIHSSSHPAPSPALFESFLDMVPSFTGRKDLHLAHIQLYHPTNPDGSLAVKVLKRARMEKTSLGARDNQPCKSYPESRTITLGLDTAKHFLERDQHSDARWVMNYLQDNYAKQLGLTQKEQFEQAQAEASSLELLRNLNLA